MKKERQIKERLSSQQRILTEIKLMSEHHYEGMTNRELAHEMGTTECTVSRDMALFDAMGYVQKTESGKVRLSPMFAGIAGQVAKAYRTAKLKLTADEARYASAMQ